MRRLFTLIFALFILFLKLLSMVTVVQKIFLSHRSVNESIFLSRVEGSMSRVRVPCRGSRVTFFFSKLFFFFEKVIIDSINVIKTNKKDFAGGEGGEVE